MNYQLLSVAAIVVLGLWFVMRSNTPRDWRNDPVTQKQLDFLEDLGYEGPAPLTKGEASYLIDKLKENE